MKTILLLAITTLLLCSCAENKELMLNGRVRTFEYYGLYDKHEVKNDSVNYQLCWESILFGAIVTPSIIPSLYIIGWNLYEPVSTKVEYIFPENKRIPLPKEDTLILN